MMPLVPTVTIPLPHLVRRRSLASSRTRRSRGPRALPCASTIGSRSSRTLLRTTRRWYDAILTARHSIHVEMYIIHEDDQGELFAAALIKKAREGVEVRLLYDWLGGFRKASRGFWQTPAHGWR